MRPSSAMRRLFAWVVLSLWLGSLSPSSLLLAQAPPDGADAESPDAAQVALSRRFLYQGRLSDAIDLVTDLCDMRFRLFDAASGGAAVGALQTVSEVPVRGGLFTVVLNNSNQFGPNAFSGDRRWLQIAVRCPAGSGEFVTLNPRQELTAAPYALYALQAGSAQSADSVPWSGVTGIPDAVANPTTYTAGAGLMLNGGQFSVLFAGSGIQTVAARSDHIHFGQSWVGDAAWGGLTITNTNTSKVDHTYTLSVIGHNRIGIAAKVIGSESSRIAVFGEVDAPFGNGIYGVNNFTGDNVSVYGVYGTARGTRATGVYGVAQAYSGANKGVAGHSNSPIGHGVYGYAAAESGLNFGVRGISRSVGGRGVDGRAEATSGTNMGVFGATSSPNGYAGFFSGKVYVLGDINALTKTFRIDHPLDPEHKVLVHSTVESWERLNVYTGLVVLDTNGAAEVTLPDWFGALNTNMRYQLTAVGAPGPNLYIQSKFDGTRFRIAGGAPGMEVSWEVSGVRQDAYALANPLLVEQDKRPEEMGLYLAAEAYGQPAVRGLHAALTAGPAHATDAPPQE